MIGGVPFMLETASRHAHEWNWLFLALLLVSSAVTLAVGAIILVFAVRYRRGSSADRSGRIRHTYAWEISWTAATFLAFIALFAWGTDLFARIKQPPADTLQIFVVGKQWMWKMQHPGGQREIDELHLPIGVPVRLVLASEDVIHSFHVPAFRLTQDAVPGRYTSLWFTADRLGRYRIFCTEFCGTDHAAMAGFVTVMTAEDYQSWLSTQPPEGTLAQQGRSLFSSYGCSGCHGVAARGPDGRRIAPPLAGLFGRAVPLSDGRTVTADDRYLRDSILNPHAEIVAGYAPVMPSFAGQIGEDDLLKLLAYIESLGLADGGAP